MGSLGEYSLVANRRGDVSWFFEIFLTTTELIRTTPLTNSQEKNSDQDLFTTDLLHFQFLLSKNAHLTLIWSLFTWYYSFISLMNDSFATNQSKFFRFTGWFPTPRLLNFETISDPPSIKTRPSISYMRVSSIRGVGNL